MAKHAIYQFYAELSDYEPKIWRRFLINGEKTMAELAYVVMIIFEMHASHLFTLKRNIHQELFRGLRKEIPEGQIRAYIQKNKQLPFLKNISYEIVHEGVEVCLHENERLVEANEVSINHELCKLPVELLLNYDFGDNWNIKLSLESYENKEVSLVHLPRVLAGEGFGIIEDAGGVHGLKKIEAVLKKTNHPDYRPTIEWIGIPKVTLDHFDRDDLNFRLKKLIRVYRDSYELGLIPTEKSVKIIERAYQKKVTMRNRNSTTD